MEQVGLEPTTSCVRSRRSPTELQPQCSMRRRTVLHPRRRTPVSRSRSIDSPAPFGTVNRIADMPVRTCHDIRRLTAIAVLRRAIRAPGTTPSHRGRRNRIGNAPPFASAAGNRRAQTGSGGLCGQAPETTPSPPRAIGLAIGCKTRRQLHRRHDWFGCEILGDRAGEDVVDGTHGAYLMNDRNSTSTKTALSSTVHQKFATHAIPPTVPNPASVHHRPCGPLLPLATRAPAPGRPVRAGGP